MLAAATWLSLCFAVAYYPVTRGIDRGTMFGVMSLMWIPAGVGAIFAYNTLTHWKELHAWHYAVVLGPLLVPLSLLVLVLAVA